MPKIIDLEQGSPEWLEYRRGKVMASELPIIMNVGYTDRYTLWKRKLGLEPEQPMMPWMQRGHDLEPLARKKYCEEYDVQVYPCVLESYEYPWAGASLDGYNPERNIGVEIKCPGVEDHALAMQGFIPEKYRPQLQWQMMVANMPSITYMSFDGDKACYLTEKADKKYQVKLLKEAELFHHMVVNGTPPEESHIFIDDEEFDRLSLLYFAAKAREEAAKKEGDSLKKALADMGDDGSCMGRHIKMTRVTRDGQVSWAKAWKEAELHFPDLKEKVDLDRYKSKEIGFYRITEIKE